MGRRLAKSKNLEQLTAKEEEGDWSETITEKSDGCDYTKTCVQPEYNWDANLSTSPKKTYEYLDYNLPEPEGQAPPSDTRQGSGRRLSQTLEELVA